MNIEVTATVINILEPVIYGTTETQKVWIKTNESYPQTLEITFINKKDVIKHLVVNQPKKFHINLNGRQKDDKVYNSLVCWKFENPTA
jgi:hypothetical protein